MKRKIILTLITILLLCSCQKTPTATDVEVEKETNNITENVVTTEPVFAEKIDVSDLSTVTLIEEPINKTVTVAGKTITINGTIIRPSSLNYLCVYEAVETGCGEECVDNMMFLFGENQDKATFCEETGGYRYLYEGEERYVQYLHNYQLSSIELTTKTAAIYEDRLLRLVHESERELNLTIGEGIEKADEIKAKVGVKDFILTHSYIIKETVMNQAGYLGFPDQICIQYHKYFQGVPLLSCVNSTKKGYSLFLVAYSNRGVDMVKVIDYNYTPIYVCEECINIDEDTDFESIFTAEFIKEYEEFEIEDGTCFETIRFEYAALDEEINGVRTTVIKPCWRFISVETDRYQYQKCRDVIVDATNGNVYLQEGRSYSAPLN